MNDAEAWQLLRQLGPDQNTLDYGFSLRFTNGAINSDINIYNQLNELIYNKFSMHFETPDPFNTTPFILSKTTFYRHEYGDQFMNSFGNRLGLTCPADKLNCLRSVVMDP